MNATAQPQKDVRETSQDRPVQLCRSCGWPIRDCCTPAYRNWCDSMRRLLVLTAVQPEQCHPNCFVAAITQGTKARPGGSA